MYDLNSIQQDLTSNVTSSVTDQLINWILIPSIVFTVLFLVFYIAHIIHRHKIDKAILETRDILRDIRDNAPRALSPLPAHVPEPKQSALEKDSTTPSL